MANNNNRAKHALNHARKKSAKIKNKRQQRFTRRAYVKTVAEAITSYKSGVAMTLKQLSILKATQTTLTNTKDNFTPEDHAVYSDGLKAIIATATHTVDVLEDLHLEYFGVAPVDECGEVGASPNIPVYNRHSDMELSRWTANLGLKVFAALEWVPQSNNLLLIIAQAGVIVTSPNDNQPTETAE